jgi:hypothetical protein
MFCYYPFDALSKCQINQPPVQRSPEVQDTIGISLVQAYRAYLPCVGVCMYITQYAVQYGTTQNDGYVLWWPARGVVLPGCKAVRPYDNRELAVPCGLRTPVQVIRTARCQPCLCCLILCLLRFVA